MEHLRQALAPICMWASNICTERANKIYNEEERVLDTRDIQYTGMLARFYVKEGMSDMERWHNKLGHVGTKIIKSCEIPGLKIPTSPFRCESCIRGKMHSGYHSSKSTGRVTDLKPGEYIITDLQGPYVGSINGHKYSQIFMDVASKKVWIVRLSKKSHI